MAMTLRLPAPLQEEAAAYADSLGISLTNLLAVALRDYLDARQRTPKSGEPPVPLASAPPSSQPATSGQTLKRGPKPPPRKRQPGKSGAAGLPAWMSERR